MRSSDHVPSQEMRCAHPSISTSVIGGNVCMMSFTSRSDLPYTGGGEYLLNLPAVARNRIQNDWEVSIMRIARQSSR